MPARSIEQVRNLSKRRGFVFPGSAAYGGLGSFWDYGPLGAELLNNIKRAWWRDVVYRRDDVDGIDAAILMSRKVWQHSGHEATFSDPMVDCRNCRSRFRADHVASELDVARHAYVSSVEEMLHEVPNAIELEGRRLLTNRLLTAIQTNSIDALARIERARQRGDGFISVFGQLAALDPDVLESGRRYAEFIQDHFEVFRQAYFQLGLAVCPNCAARDWTLPRNFNLMFKTHVGPVEATDAEAELSARAYLRPETAQGIFMNFAHVQRSLARKVPFGIAQVGKAFRNEITPGNFIFRTREFEQMEIEFFIKPPQFVREGEKNDAQWHDEWINQRYEWWLGLGVDSARLRQREQAADELAHYSKRTVDLEYLFPEFGWGEVEGIANRTDYDLTAHSRDIPAEDLARLKLEPNTDSVEKFDYFDPDAKARYIPWVIEPSAGATRAMLAFLCEAYHEELTKDPPQPEIEAIKAEIPAVVKNAQKKQKDAEKETDPAQRKHDPAAIEAFCTALEEAASRLPQSLLEIDALLTEHPGAHNLEPVKKLQPKVNKLAEDCARVVLKLHPSLAPIKLAVFPLKKNKPELVDIARRIAQTYQPHFRTVYDDSAGIGRLYRRQDEIGTPWCVTVDFQTLEDNTVTVRERDSMQQQRINLEALRDYFFTRIHV
ncbi:MAG: glycine--tRNA ligase [Planctomycetes bacterium]|nr:glycine--tRNA ligase [Planctomycetota bacterium]